MRRMLFLLLGLSLVMMLNPPTLLAQTYSPPASARATYNFNPGWKLFVGDPAGAEASGFDDSSWKAITLPHAWNEDDAFRVAIGSLSTGIAWYRKHFVLPPGSNGKKVFLEFEGIRHAGEFYVNGLWIGRHENGVMAIGLDITNALPYPQENVVAVRIDNSYSYQEIATGTSFQWNSSSFYANYGGINKNVKLHLTGKTYQTLPLFSNLGTVGTYIYALNLNVPARSAVIHADTQVRNEDAVAHTLNYEVVVVDTNGLVLTNFTGGSVTIQPGQTNVLTASSLVANLNFWSWGYGYLYDVYTIVKESGAVLDVVRTRTGFRKTQFTGGTVTLNDRAIDIHGYAQRTTDEWPAIGTSVPVWMSDFSQRMVVDGGGNNMRWMHVTPAKQTIEACDRQGLLQAMPAGDAEGDSSGRQWDQRVELMRDAIIYNKNNPSIIFYESGNSPVSEAHMIQMKSVRDQYDPFGGRAIGSRSMMGSTNAEYGGEMLYIDKSATKPMWMMEYMRDEALRRYWDEFSPPYHSNGDYVHQNCDSIALQNVIQWDDYFVQRPGTGTRVNAGGVKIIFSDSNTHFRGYQNYRGSGATDALRIPKDTWFVHQVMWDCWVDVEKPRAYIIGHWNYTNGVVKDINVVSTAAYVELFRNGTSLGYGTESENFLFTWNNVTWVPGTLQAVGYDSQGNQICTDTRVTTGLGAAIRLTPILDPTGWKADGHDLAMYEVEVVDAQGHRCPTNFDMITFTLTGPAEWRGGLAVRSDTVAGDNYILSTNLPVECGVNRVLVRSSTNAGTITLTATAPGLTSATTNLNTIPFTVTNGLATLLPGEGMPPNYSRGPTPLAQSYQIARVPIPVSNIIAGAASTTLTNTIDDNETTSWTSSSTLGQNWIQFNLARTALVSQVVIKFLTPPRNGIYPISIQVGGTTLYNATTPATTGYLTVDVTPTLGNNVRISRTTSGSFPLMEVEIYEAVNTGTLPATPTGLTATPVSSTQINLAWTDNATNEIGFKIERSTDGVSFTSVGTRPLNATNFQDLSLAPISNYFYRVRSYNAAGESSNAVASATTLSGPPAAPTGLTATPGDTQISLVWNASGGATNYVIQRSTNSGGPYATIATTSGTSYVNTNLLNGTNYYYVVAAAGQFGQSVISAQAGATPTAGLVGDFWINTITTAPQSWNVISNWNNGVEFPDGIEASAIVNSSIAANQTINLNELITLRSLGIGAAGGAFNLADNGGSLTFDNTPDTCLLRQFSTSSTNTISASLTLASELDVVNDSTKTLTLSGVISGASDLTINGDVTLSGANSFTGDTIITNGPLRLAQPLTLQTSTLNCDGGTVSFSGITAATLGGLTGSQNINLMSESSAPVTLTVGANNAPTTYNGSLTGSGSLIKTGTGVLTLTGSNSQTGNTTVQGGNLTIADGTFGAAGSSILVGNGSGGISFNVTGGFVTGSTLNIATLANSTGDNASVTGSGSIAFNAVNLGSSANTGGPFTINTTGSVALGTFVDSKDLGGNGPSTATGLIVNQGTVTANSVLIQNTGSGANMTMNGGSLTIGNSSSTGAFRIGNGNSTRGGFLTMTGGSLTYLGTDGLLVATLAGTRTGVSMTGGTAKLTGITLNQVNSATLTSSLIVSNNATLYLGGVGLVANQPSATVFIALAAAKIGAMADWTSVAPITLSGLTTFQAADVSNVTHNISLNGVLSGTGGLIKTGTGLLTLSGTDTYTGVTSVSVGKLLVNGSLASGSTVIVSNTGTLGGTGKISGPVTIQSGGTLSPGVAMGTLTISNSLTLSSGATSYFEISKTPFTNDVVKVFGALGNGGTLMVTNVSGTLALGDSFKLFDATSYSGNFASLNLPPLNSGLGWNTNSLNTAGIISIVAVAPPAPPHFGSVSLQGGNFIFSGAGGTAGASYYVLTSTNAALPIGLWTSLVTNVFDAGGNFGFTNTLNGSDQRYFRLQVP